MLNRIEKDKIGKLEFINILTGTSMKIFRGLFVKIFLKKSSGLLFVGKRCQITNKQKIVVGRNVKFEDECEIQGLSTKGIILGDNVTIGRYTMIRPSSYYGVEVGEGVEIGNNSSIGPLGYVGCAGYIKIGNNVMIGPKVSLFAENHKFDNPDKNIKEQGLVRKGITIEDNCWIGSNVIILDGVRIGTGSVIGAGTVITKDVSPNSIVLDERKKLVRVRKGK